MTLWTQRGQEEEAETGSAWMLLSELDGIFPFCSSIPILEDDMIKAFHLIVPLERDRETVGWPRQLVSPFKAKLFFMALGDGQSRNLGYIPPGQSKYVKKA